MRKLYKDSWFQVFTAVAGVAGVVSLLGTVSSRHATSPASSATAPSTVAAPSPPPASSPSAPIAAAPDGPITPAPASSSDLASYAARRDPSALIMGPGSSVASVPAPDPSADPDPNPPKITLTGTGVGNTQGITGSPPGGLSTLFNSLLGRPQSSVQVAIASPPMKIAPARKGVFKVGPAASGADTASLRDAVFSAADNDLILVEPGSYDGELYVTKKTVRIRGTGSKPGDVRITMTGPGATVSVYEGALRLENLRVERGYFFESPRIRPGGAVYVKASSLFMRQVELHSADLSAPPLIIERGDKLTRVMVEDSGLTGSEVNVIVRGSAYVRLLRVRFNFSVYPIAAWLDAKVELQDCRFAGINNEIIINAYEGAHATVTGQQKPRVSEARPRNASDFEDSFGGWNPGLAGPRFSRDIFRRGRQAGSVP